MFNTHDLEVVENIITRIQAQCPVFENRVYYAFSLSAIYDPGNFTDPNPIDCYVVFAGDTPVDQVLGEGGSEDGVIRASSLMQQEIYVVVGVKNRDDQTQGLPTLRLAGQGRLQVRQRLTGWNPITGWGAQLGRAVAPPTFQNEAGMGFFPIGFTFVYQDQTNLADLPTL